jgi:chromosome partitioning protein
VSPRIIAVANHKGGVGKTTTTVNLAGALAEAGQRVLLIDLDPQHSTTVAVGVDPETCAETMYHVLVQGAPISEVILPVEPLDLEMALAPASAELADAQVQLWDKPARDQRLKLALEDLDPLFDVALIDCPPSLNIFTMNALIAAHEVLIPVQPQLLSVAVLRELLAMIAEVREVGNRKLRVGGFLVNQVKQNTVYHRQMAEHLRGELARFRVFDAVIPDSIRVQEATNQRLPVVRYDPASTPAVAYRQLAQEVLGASPAGAAGGVAAHV